LNVHLIALVLFLAAVLGDTVNYWVGARLGPAVFKREDSFLLRKKHLDRAHEFFLRYGGRAIVLARFVPIVRTFVPFVAGVGRMPYGRFIAYNVAGGFVWVYFFTYAGYFFGTHPVVQRNFKLVILAIIVLSGASHRGGVLAFVADALLPDRRFRVWVVNPAPDVVSMSPMDREWRADCVIVPFAPTIRCAVPCVSMGLLLPDWDRLSSHRVDRARSMSSTVQD
jgi:membrane protein YqaA with SNARE-associated domain